MKYISLSFDDARVDTYTNAFKILNKYNLKATLNVISGFVMGTYDFKLKQPMTTKQLLEWQKNGNEIAGHGSTHQNTKKDVIRNIRELSAIGIDVTKIGFASPNSELTVDNMSDLGIEDLYKKRKLYYLRSGIQIRREGLFYVVLSVLEMLTHSNNLFCWLNERNIIKTQKTKLVVLPAVAIKKYTTLNEIYALINKMEEDDKIILMFHSILYHEDKGYGEDSYYWDAKLFDELCKSFSVNNDVKVCTTLEMVEEINKSGKRNAII